MRKLRTNAGDKGTSNAKEVLLSAIHNTKYYMYIPIDHPILNDHGVLYPRALSHPLCFEITFAPVVDVLFFQMSLRLQTIKSLILSSNISVFKVNILQNKRLMNIKSEEES